MLGSSEQKWADFTSSLLAACEVTPVPPCGRTEELIRAVEGEIEHSRQLTSRLLSARNNLAPVAQLPAELLSHIFEIIITANWDDYVSVIDPDEYVYYPSLRRFRQGFVTLADVTHVCRRWRQVALEYPALWRDILWERSSWSAEMLHRTKGIPLDIHAIDVDPDAVGVVNAQEASFIARSAFPHLHRARWITLRGSAPDPDAIEQLSKPALLLESARLEYTNFGGSDDQPQWRSTLFGGQAPCLRYLTIRGNIEPALWSSSIFSGLNVLKMVIERTEDYETRERTFPRPLLDDFLHALAQMKPLETLILHHHFLPVLPPATRTLPPPSLVVHLPRLKNFSMSASFLDCVNFANHLAIHPDANVSYAMSRITAIPSLHRQSDDDVLLSLLKPSSMSPDVFTDLDVLCKRQHHYTLQAWGGRRGLPSLLSMNIPRFSLDVIESISYADLLPTFVRVYGFEHIRTLTCALSHPGSTPSDCHKLFGPFKAVEELTVDGYQDPYGRAREAEADLIPMYTSPILGALGEVDQDGRILFPRMTCLHLVEFSFKDVMGEAEFREGVVKVLRRVVERPHSTEIRSLKVERCAITEAQVSFLSDVVTDL